MCRELSILAVIAGRLEVDQNKSKASSCLVAASVSHFKSNRFDGLISARSLPNVALRQRQVTQVDWRTNVTRSTFDEKFTCTTETVRVPIDRSSGASSQLI
jgi:hypothetical protein